MLLRGTEARGALGLALGPAASDSDVLERDEKGWRVGFSPCPGLQMLYLGEVDQLGLRGPSDWTGLTGWSALEISTTSLPPTRGLMPRSTASSGGGSTPSQDLIARQHPHPALQYL